MVAGESRCERAWVLCAVLLAGCAGTEETDSALPSGSASIGDSTGGDDGSTGDPTSPGVTSSVPTTNSSNSDPTNPSDPTLDPSESDGGCEGCINAAGICESGGFDNACGRGGEPCMECEAPSQCDEGVCAQPPSCTPDNCDGCCDGDTCVESPTNAQCGADGSECTECNSEATCTAGACELPCEDTCLGCCDESGNCIDDEDQSDAQCGFLGFDCESCGGDESCDFGLCSSPSCLKTCDGCCVGSECFDGYEDSACGFQEACAVCSGGTSCNAFGTACEVTPGLQWQVTLLDGEIVALTDGNSWDAFGGAPDPYLVIDELTAESSVQDNTLDPAWNETLTSSPLTSDLQAQLTFSMWDSDLDPDDLIGTCTVNLPDEAFGALHEVTCNVDGSFAWSVLLSIQTVEK